MQSESGTRTSPSLGTRYRLAGAVVYLWVVALLATDAAAQGRPRRVWQPKRIERGVTLSAAGATTFLTAEFYDIYLRLRPGAGLALGFGYRWSRHFQTHLVLTYTEHRTEPDWLWRANYGFLLAELQVVVPFLRWRKMVLAGVACYGRGLLAGGEEALGGISLAAGLQLEYFVAPRWTVGLAGYARYIDYTRVQYRIPTFLSTGTVDGSNLTLFWLRLAWHLGRLH